jgi:hypothetical protein
MSLAVKPQYGPGARREWAIVRTTDDARQQSEATGALKSFVAYSRTWTGAQRAIREIEASLRRLDRFSPPEPQAITQQLIDSRPLNYRPIGVIRQLIWNAAKRQTA